MLRVILFAGCAANLAFWMAGTALAQGSTANGMAMPRMAVAPSTTADDRQVLLDRIEALERRLADIDARLNGGGATTTVPAAQAASLPANADRTAELEQRVSELETNVVLSEPKTTVKRIEVWVDKNGTQYDHPVPGAKETTTYQRETTARRQAISEEIEEAMADADSRRVRIGVSSAFTLQRATQTSGRRSPADGHSYALASADLLFTAGLAQNTIFFADVVGLSGNPPDTEIKPLTLLNSFTARLSRQNELNLREAWVRTELFNQKLALTVGRLDLTNYFDRNAAANDESTQFLSDSLVNNPALGLSSNGAGFVAVYEPYSGLSFRVGAQQSNPLATNLSESAFALGEVGYLMRPFGLPEGNYRVWGRTDNSSGRRSNAFGVSIDQKLTPIVTVFGRFGTGKIGRSDIRFYGTGVQFQNGWVVNPLDTWGVGYTHTEFSARDEDLVEIYYNVHLTEKLRVSPHVQYVHEGDGADTRGFVLPGLRLQTSF
jgi:hypothetical protein